MRRLPSYAFLSHAFLAPRFPFLHRHHRLPRRRSHSLTRTGAVPLSLILPDSPISPSSAACITPHATPSTPPASAYIHLPFCAQKCGYCDFAVTVSTDTSAHSAYVDVLVDEIAAVRALTLSPVKLDTVYLGGGTPSLLSTKEIGRVLDAIDDAFGIEKDAEVTAEMDPATFDAKKANGFRAAGVNRVSVGVQSVDDRLLALCGRRHQSEDVHVALETLSAAGFQSVSVDVMAGLPGQTAAMYEDTIREVLRRGVDHISAYDLSLEPGTPFDRKYTSGVSPLPAESDGVRMLERGRAVLESEGFERYEVSNYARGTDSRSRHNMTYWHGDNFYGMGLSATSLAHGVRYARPRVMSQYRRYVQGLQVQLEEGLRAGDDTARVLYPGVDKCSEMDMLEDFLINRFRLLVEGVCLADMRERFEERHVKGLLNAVRKSGFVEQGLMEIVAETCVRLTQRGAMIENSVLADVLQEAIWKTSTTGDGRSG